MRVQPPALAVFVALACCAGPVPAAGSSGLSVPEQCLVLPPVGRHRRTAFHADPLEARIVAGTWQPPKAGEEVLSSSGKPRRWHTQAVDKDGWFRSSDLEGGYAYLAVEATAERIVILKAAGHSLVYVNGELHTGDPYGNGSVHLPIALKRGRNDLLFAVGRGSVRVELAKPSAAAFLDTADLTLPDLLIGEQVKTQGAVVVVNATSEPFGAFEIQATLAEHTASSRCAAIPPLSIRKVGFAIEGTAPSATGHCPLKVELRHRPAPDESPVLDRAELNLDVKRPEQSHKRTFRSAIDNSVQYYAITPAAPGGTGRPGLVLSLHGAGVEASGQAACYAPKTWAHIVAPTNRRSYGFDWEDWGRLDALEVLDLTSKELAIDPQRVYLSGHSMGGHGTWQIGALFPDRFAAIGPSAGWISMFSYADAPRAEHPDAMEALFERAVGSSDTLALEHNYRQLGVYILHGDRDDNVPVAQARTMRERLGKFHPDFAYHEQPGAGHWWGNACMDWPPLFEFLHEHQLPRPGDVKDVEFITPSPGVSARCHWATIETQQEMLRPSSIRLHWDEKERRLSGGTQNVTRLALDLGQIGSPGTLHVQLDGEKAFEIAPERALNRIWLQRTGKNWAQAEPPPASDKGPERYGPFKQAFSNHVCFVYGTRGTPAENAWAFAKARYDAETFWYRGNGSVDVLADSAFDAAAEPERSVILYGNADSNAAWTSLLGESPVQVRRGGITLGGRSEDGETLACLFVRPRPQSRRALVGVISGSGVEGMHLTDRLAYFASGVGYPDCVILGADVLNKGIGGVRAAGYFGSDWSVPSGEFVWHK